MEFERSEGGERGRRGSLSRVLVGENMRDIVDSGSGIYSWSCDLVGYFEADTS